MKIAELKKRIKSLSLNQKRLKPQRKQNYKGIRKYSQNQASEYARQNKFNLMHMYHVYAELRGKVPTPPKNKILNERVLKNLREQYSEKVA